MFHKFILAAALAATPLALSETASADHCSRGYRGYSGYRAPVVSYYAPSPARYYYGGRYSSGYRGSLYRSPYQSFYGPRYGYGGYGYGMPYGRGTAIGVGRGGISLNFGF